MRHESYHFYGCVADAATRELRRDGRLVTSSPKVFDCLIYLIEHRDRAVGRDELIAAVWGRADVSDALLGQTMLKARRAIGDTGHEQTAIRTVPRFGYRWIAETSTKSTVAATTESAHVPDTAPAKIATMEDASRADERVPEMPPSPSRRTRSRLISGVLAVAAVVALLVALLRGWQQHDTQNHPAAATQALAPSHTAVAEGSVDSRDADGTVAVMPVANTAGDDWFWLQLGLMDQIGRRLHLAGQAVVPSSNIVALTRASPQAETIPYAKVWAATGARYVVLPHATRTANGWRVQLDLHEGDRSKRVVEAQSDDVVAAANAATDSLLIALGKTPPSEQDSETFTINQLLQRTDAVLLGSDFDGARRVIETAPPALRNQPAARFMLARIDWHAGALDTASERLRALLGEVSAERDPALRARLLYTLGAVEIREDRSADAVPLLTEALKLRSRENLPAELGETYTAFAGALINLGRYEEAGDALARARVQLGLAGDTLALAIVDANEGSLDIARGRPAEALPLLQRAKDCFRLFGWLSGRFLTTAAEVKAHLALLDSTAALAASDAIEPQLDQHDSAHIRGTLGVQRAWALVANGRIGEATHLLDQLAVEISHDEHSGLPGDIASARSRLSLGAGDNSAAAREASAAVAALPTVDEQYERARAWRTLVLARQAGTQANEAATQLDEFSQWARKTAQPAPTLYAALARAEHARDLHRADEAYQEYAAALDDAARWGVPADLAAVVVSYGNALIADGKLDQASEVIGRVARWADHDFDCALLQARLYNALGQHGSAETAMARARSLAGERVVPALPSAPLVKVAHE
ncbi:winged helix-turn-helix domain-containing protein [Pseudolysobacter antarcticus]|nr:winged helix-turn-helix domain-containing protein [Pseudolysobacter antarcticus]